MSARLSSATASPRQTPNAKLGDVSPPASRAQRRSHASAASQAPADSQAMKAAIQDDPSSREMSWAMRQTLVQTGEKAFAAERAGDFKEAIRLYQSMALVSDAPTRVKVRQRAASLSVVLGEAREALAILSKASSDYGSDGTDFFNGCIIAARAQRQLGEYQLALYEAMDAVHFAPHDIEALYQYSVMLKHTGDLPEAIRNLERAQRIANQNGGNVAVSTALAGYKVLAGDVEGGRALFESVPKPSKDDVFYNSNAAWFHAIMGDYDKVSEAITWSLGGPDSGSLDSFLKMDPEFAGYRESPAGRRMMRLLSATFQ